MTVIYTGFIEELQKREWALVNSLGNLGQTGLAVTAVAGDRTVSVATGMTAAAGVLSEVTAAHSLQATANGSGFTRYDLVIWRLEWGAVNTATLAVKAGTPSASPVAPTLTQDAGVLWEHPLALLDVGSGQGAFLAGDVIPLPSAADPVQGTQATDAGPSSVTTYVFPGASCFATFVAPPSGKVRISIMASMDNTAANQATLSSFEIRQGLTQGGAVFLAAADANAILLRGSTVNETRSSDPVQIGGLTPGGVYTAWHKVRVGGGTGNWYHRRIQVDPVL